MEQPQFLCLEQGHRGSAPSSPFPSSGKEDSRKTHSELIFSLFPTSWQQAVGVTSSDLDMFGYGSSIQICSVLSRLNAGAAARLGMPMGLSRVSAQEECRDVTCWVTPGSMLECCDTQLVQPAGKGSGTRGLYPSRVSTRGTRAVQAAGQHGGNKRLRLAVNRFKLGNQERAFNHERSEIQD